MQAVDVSFALRGTTIPADHGWSLFRLLAERLEWLDAEADAGVHPIRGSDAGAGKLYLSPRARLTLRLPETRAAESFALAGARLELGEGIEIGAARQRPLIAHSTLYSPFVVASDRQDEDGFERDVNEELRKADVECRLVCGRKRSAHSSVGTVAGFALMLYGLSSADSLKVQQKGLGAGRKLGCGVFVPHRSAAAVGSERPS